MVCNHEKAMKGRRLITCLFGLGLAVTGHAQVQIALPVGGAAPGQSIRLPLQIPPSTNLAGVQCDILFDATWLVCDGAQFVAGTAGVVVDGANAVPEKPGMFRLLAYTSLGTPLTNGVTCALAFRVLPEAPGGEITLSADTNFVFGSSALATLPGNQPSSGLVLVGDAFALGDVFTPVSAGTLWQFHATTNTTWVTLASTDLIAWEAVATNTALDGLVFSFDGKATSFASRFYQVKQQ